MRTISYLLLTTILSVEAYAQTTQEEWLDSISSETYIAMEVWLDEMELTEKRNEAEAAAYGFYKNNPLNATDDVLSRLSGISMIRRGNYAWEPTINGLSGGQINVAIDGMRMFGACTDKMDPVSSYVEPNNLESIVVEKGGAGSAVGSTVGGAVDFRMKRPKFDAQLGGSVNARYESVSNGYSQSASLGFGDKKFAVRANAGFRSFGDYRNGQGNEVYHSGYKKFNFSISTSYKTSANNLIDIDFLLDDANDVGYPGLPMDVAYAKARMGAISYITFNLLSWVDQAEFKLYANSVDHLMDDSKRQDVPVRMDMPGETRTYGAFFSASSQFDKHTLKYKLDGYATNAYAEMTMFVPNETDMFMLTWPDVDRQDAGLFVSDQWRISEKFGTTISVRVEQAFTQMNSQMGQNQFAVFGYNENDFKSQHLVLNTGAKFNYRWSKPWTGNLGFSYGERLPSVSEMFGFYLYNNFDGYDYVGNPNIKKETSSQLTTSIKYNPSKKLEINWSGFHYWFDNYIIGFVDDNLDAMTINANGTKVYSNIPGVKFSGFDASILYSPVKSLQLLYAVKSTYATDGEGEALPMIPPLKNNLTIVATIKEFRLQAEGEWSLAQRRINESTGEQATSAYQLVHLRGSRDWQWNKLTLGASVGVENLLDESYREHLDWGGVLRPGRNVYASLKVKF